MSSSSMPVVIPLACYILFTRLDALLLSQLVTDNTNISHIHILHKFSRLAKYQKIEKPVGEGTYGVVYKVRFVYAHGGSQFAAFLGGFV